MGDRGSDIEVGSAQPPRTSGPYGWGGRLPLLSSHDLDDAKRAMLDHLKPALTWAHESGFAAATSDGRLIGPFNAFLHAPELGEAYTGWVNAERAHTSLPPQVREVVILTVGAEWRARYEVYAHAAAARSSGLRDSVIEAAHSGCTTDEFTAEQRAAHQFAQELIQCKSVASDTYLHTEATFGRHGVLDLVHLIGLYLATSALLNAFDVPAPRSADPPRQPVGD